MFKMKSLMSPVDFLEAFIEHKNKPVDLGFMRIVNDSHDIYHRDIRAQEYIDDCKQRRQEEIKQKEERMQIFVKTVVDNMFMLISLLSAAILFDLWLLLG